MGTAHPKKFQRTLVATLVAAGLSSVACEQASAQSQGDAAQAAHLASAASPASAASAPDQAVKLDAVVVTATRREQLLQDVPIAVTAVSGKALEASNYQDVTDIQYLAPGVTFSSTNPISNGGGFEIRGVGTQTYDSGVEQSVGLVVDGVVLGLSRDPGVTGFSDIDRVEVLRGPQGTLFGKNASAGVIQIITKMPQIGQNSGDVSVSYGERDERVIKGNANIATGSDTALRLSAYFDAQDGAIPYLLRPDEHIGDRKNEGVRAKFLWTPSDDLSILLSTEHQHGFSRDAQIIDSLGTSAVYNSLFASFPVQPGPNTYLSYQDGDWTATSQVNGSSAQVNYSLGDFTLTSITAYRAVKTAQLCDIDAAPINILNNSDGGVQSNQFTQEIRLTSPSGKRFEYVVGAYYYHTRNNDWVNQYGDYYGVYGLPIAFGGGYRLQDDVNRSVALFGQSTYGLTDSLKLITGLRYTKDDIHGTLTVTPETFPAIPVATLPPYDGQFSAQNVSGRVGLQFNVNHDLMLYGTYSTGYKGPAIDGSTGTPHEVKPETVRSVELGARATLLGGRMMFNATVYSSDYRDFQAQTLDTSGAAPVFALSNAGLMRTQGVELESTVRVTEHLDISGSATYDDATFKNFYAACYAGQPMSSVVGQGCYNDPVTGLQTANYAGQQLPNAPRWTYNLRGSHRYPLDNGLQLDSNLSWAWRDKTQSVVADPQAVVQSYGLLNMNLGVGKQNGQWRVGIYARNLLDKHFAAPYSGVPINPGGYFEIVPPDAFRTVGINLSAKF